MGEPPVTGIDPPASAVGQTLAEGTRLQEFRITGVIGQGGFGVVYRAEDLALQRQVAIKEYLPAQLATRGADGALRPSGDRHAETYAAGLDGFLDEARLLARFKHPGLLEVLRFWKQNGTAYLAMPLYAGSTLDRVIESHPGGLEAAPLRAILGSLLDALETLHAGGCVHRDVAPDNVMVLPDGSAVLLDLGAARRVIGDRVKAVTVMLKGGYAPIEQYADDPTFRIGPWTDVYALGALLHHAITGEVPPVAPMRMMRDTRVPLARRDLRGHDPKLLAAIDAAMALRPDARPASIAAFRAMFDPSAGPTSTVPRAPAFAARVAPPQVPPVPAPPGTGAPAGFDAPAPSADPARVPGPPPAHAALRLPVDDDPFAAVEPPARRPWAIAAGVAGALALALAVGAWLAAGSPAGTPDVAAADAAPPPVATTPASTGGAAASAGATPARAPSAAPSAAAPSAAAPTSAATGAPAAGPVAPASAAAAAPTPADPSAEPGTLRLAVVPWAEVWIDGESRGVSPPVKSLKLAPGTYRVELRNPAAPPSVHRVEIVAGRAATLSHRIQESQR